MDNSEFVRLLIACGIGAVVGFNGTSPYGGAIFFTMFALLAAFGAWSSHVPFTWLEIGAPIAFAYGAAAINNSMRKR